MAAARVSGGGRGGVLSSNRRQGGCEARLQRRATLEGSAREDGPCWWFVEPTRRNLTISNLDSTLSSEMTNRVALLQLRCCRLPGILEEWNGRASGEELRSQIGPYMGALTICRWSFTSQAGAGGTPEQSPLPSPSLPCI